MTYSRIVATGSYLPGRSISNADISCVFDIDEWLMNSLGVKTRHWSLDIEDRIIKESGAEMTAKACRKALEQSNLQPSDIDQIILAAGIPDYIMPNTVVVVQELLGIEKCSAIEIHAGCVGTIQALDMANNAICLGKAKNVLVCCFNLISPMWLRELEEGEMLRTVDMLNIAMFGDGAGALLVSADSEPGILAITHQSVGVGKKPAMSLKIGGAMIPASQKAIERNDHRWQHNSRAIVEEGGELSQQALIDLLDSTRMKVQDIDYFIFPQANPATLKHHLESFCADYKVPMERIFNNVDYVGNTATAALFVALDKLTRKKEMAEKVIAVVAGEASKWLYGGVLLSWQAS